MMNDTNPLLREIETFLAETGMGASYFGKKSIGNSEVVERLRSGRRVWPETEMKIREFMNDEFPKRQRKEARAGA